VVAEYSSLSYPTVYVRVNSECLWRLGSVGAVAAVRELLRDVLEVKREVLSRADLSVDFQGWGPQPDRMDSYISRCVKRAAYSDGVTVTGIQFGKGDIVARHYDKSAEISHTSKDWYRDLWKKAEGYKEAEPVDRVEFQFRRGAFTSFSPRIESFADLWEHRAALWEYVTGDWLSFRDPVDGQPRTRWPVAPAWETIRRTAFLDPSEPIIRQRRREAILEQLIPQIAGCLSSAGAIVGEDDLAKVLYFMEDRIKSYLDRKESSFQAKVMSKESRQAHLPG